MEDIYQVSLKKMVEEFGLQVVFAASDFDSICIEVEDVGRPGIQLAGYFDHFDARRLQVLGNVEMSYLSKLPDAERESVLDALLSRHIPALLIEKHFCGLLVRWRKSLSIPLQRRFCLIAQMTRIRKRICMKPFPVKA